MSGDLSTIEARREAFLSFADKFVSWDEDTQSQVLSLLNDMEDGWDLSPSQIADLEQSLIEDDEGDYASDEAVQHMFAPIRK